MKRTRKAPILERLAETKALLPRAAMHVSPLLVDRYLTALRRAGATTMRLPSALQTETLHTLYDLAVAYFVVMRPVARHQVVEQWNVHAASLAARVHAHTAALRDQGWASVLVVPPLAADGIDAGGRWMMAQWPREMFLDTFDAILDGARPAKTKRTLQKLAARHRLVLWTMDWFATSATAAAWDERARSYELAPAQVRHCAVAALVTERFAAAWAGRDLLPLNPAVGVAPAAPLTAFIPADVIRAYNASAVRDDFCYAFTREALVCETGVVPDWALANNTTNPALYYTRPVFEPPLPGGGHDLPLVAARAERNRFDAPLALGAQLYPPPDPDDTIPSPGPEEPFFWPDDPFFFDARALAARFQGMKMATTL